MKEITIHPPQQSTTVSRNVRRPVWWIQGLIICITVLAVTVTVFLGRRAYREGRLVALNQFNQQQLILARSTATSIETYFKEVITSLTSMAQVHSIQHMDPDCSKYLQYLYEGFLPRTSIRRLDEHGILRFVYPANGWRATLLDRNYGDEAFFRDVRDSRNISISGIITNEQGAARVRMAIPVFLPEGENTTNGRFTGVLVTSFALGDISRVFIDNIVSGETGYAWLMNQEGYFIAHHEDDFIGKDAFTVRAHKSPSLSFDAINEIQLEVLAGAEGIGRYMSGWHRGRSGTIEKLIAYSPARIFTQNWSVSVAAPVSEVDRIFRRVEREAMYGFGFIILVLVFAGSFLSASAYRWSYSLENEVKGRTRELHETTEYINNLIRFAKAPIIVWDTHQRVTIFNPAFETMSGRSADEMISEPLDFLFPDATRSDSLRLVEQASEGNDWEDMEIPIVRNDGEIRTVVWRSYNIYDENGESRIATFASGDDITDRKQTEEALKESEEIYRSIFEAVPASIILVKKDGQMVDINSYHINNISKGNVTKEDFMGKDITTHPSVIKAGLSETYKKVLGGKPFDLKDVYFPTTSGATDGYFNVKGVPLIKDGETVGAIITHDDVTERKHAEEALKKTMKNLFMAQEMAQLGSWEWDVITDELHWSDETYRLFGWEPKEIDVTLSTYLERVYPDDRDSVRAAMRAAFEGTGSYESEHKIIRTDGTIRILHTKGDVERDDHRKPLKMVGIVQDITELRRAEEEKASLEAQLRHAQKMESLGTLIAGVAHEINNPVNKIIFDIPLLQRIWRDAIPVLRVEAENEPRKKYGGLTFGFLKDNMEQLLTDMEFAANRVAKTVSNLKAYTRQSSITDKQPMQVNTAVENSVRLTHTTLKKASITLTLNLGDNIPRIDGNMQSIEQIITNLTINAIQAIGHTSGRIAITTGFLEQNRRVFISISDNGKGVDPSLSDKIFDPFITTRHNEGGTGLGLSITKNLVDAHGGEITFTTEKGKGTSFILFFPSTGLE